MASRRRDQGRMLHCSFCRKSHKEVAKLVSGPAVFICDECVAACVRIMAGSPQSLTSPVPFGQHLTEFSSERLLEILASQESTVEEARTLLQNTVGLLRARKVSWAAIGAALGVSRQAAWERFA